MSELGLMGIPWEEKYGGNGMDTLALVIAIEELGKECASTAATMMAHTSLGTGPIAIFGTDKQKEKYLPNLASNNGVINLSNMLSVVCPRTKSSTGMCSKSSKLS